MIQLLVTISALLHLFMTGSSTLFVKVSEGTLRVVEAVCELEVYLTGVIVFKINLFDHIIIEQGEVTALSIFKQAYYLPW